MSHSGKPISDLGMNAVANRLRDSLSCDVNKPDFREHDLGSPVSPLRTRTSGHAPSASASATTTTTSSSSSSSSGSVTGRTVPSSVSRRSEPGPKSHSGELSGSTESSPRAATRNLKPGQSVSDSGTQPLIYSGQSSVTSPAVNVLPAGNICPSGRILKTGMATTRSSRTDVLRSGSGNYGHGSIMRGGGVSATTKHKTSAGDSHVKAANPSGYGGGGGDLRLKRAMTSSDPEEIKMLGNEMYSKGCFLDALSMYDRAVALSPTNAACRSNRAAALSGLGRFGEAVRECEEAVRLDPSYARAHHRLASLLLRLGQVECARKHFCFSQQQGNPSEMQKLHSVENHLTECVNSRKVGDWKSVLREADASIASGADFSPQLVMCRVEALLKLHQLSDAESTASRVPRVEPFPSSCSQTRFFGMLSEAFPFFVKSQIEMALGRFENAVAAIEKASQIDPRNLEVSALLNNVRSVSRARARGNDLFKSERFTEACSAYTEGLKLDPSNSVLYCNRAACLFKLGLWERSIDDCNQALRIQPNYTKAVLRRAASNSKLEKWADAVRDYEVLRSELPDDTDVAESLFHAQVALKKSRGEEVHNLKFGGDVEEVHSLEQFRAAISLPGISVVHFETPSDSQCKLISPFVDTLCNRYPSINFLKVDINKCLAIADYEKVRIVPTFKIYKNGSRVKELVCPNREMLEYSVRHYSL